VTTLRKTFTVALVGPDGVGKTTIARQLEGAGTLPIKYLYMGDNVEASNYTLPTTRWWKSRRRRARAAAAAAPTGVSAPAADASSARNSPPPAVAAGTPKPSRRGLAGRLVYPFRKTLGFANRILEESYRQSVASSFVRRGSIVVFDRHFLLDYYHTDVTGARARQSLRHRLHGWFLRRVTRAPDLVICLDAPGEVVFRRKGELTPEILEMRRHQYRSLAAVFPHFSQVDANRPLAEVVRDVTAAIVSFRGGEPRASH
jgi:thymidylate kinase